MHMRAAFKYGLEAMQKFHDGQEMELPTNLHDDIYNLRPLPFVIGTSLYHQSKYAGLGSDIYSEQDFTTNKYQSKSQRQENQSSSQPSESISANINNQNQLPINKSNAINNSISGGNSMDKYSLPHGYLDDFGSIPTSLDREGSRPTNSFTNNEDNMKAPTQSFRPPTVIKFTSTFTNNSDNSDGDSSNDDNDVNDTKIETMSRLNNNKIESNQVMSKSMPLPPRQPISDDDDDDDDNDTELSIRAP